MADKQIWKTALTDSDTADIEGVGRIRWDDNTNAYRWVKNDHGSALAEGSLVFHEFSDLATALDGVVDGATADLGFMAGVSMGATAAASYGWIQIFGYNASCLVKPDTNATPAAGATMGGANGTTAGEGTLAVAMGTAPLYARHIMAVELVSMDASQVIVATKVFVNCL